MTRTIQFILILFIFYSNSCNKTVSLNLKKDCIVARSDSNSIELDTTYLKNLNKIQYSVIIHSETGKYLNSNIFPLFDMDAGVYNSVDLLEQENSYIISYEYQSVRPVYYIELYFSKYNFKLDSIEEGIFDMAETDYRTKKYYRVKDFKDSVNLYNISLNASDSLSLLKVLK